MEISLERAQQIVGCIAHEMSKADIDIPDIELEVSTYQDFLDKVDILTTALAGTVWDKITKKEYFDTLRIEGGISQAEIDYLTDLGVLHKPKFKGEN